MKKNKRFFRGMLAAASLTLSSLCASCGLIPEEETYPAAPFFVDELPGDYTTATCLRGDVVLTAQLDLKSVARQKSDLYFSVAGEHIDSFFVNVGETVTKGQLLGQLDISSYEKKLVELQQKDTEYELSLKQNEENREIALRRVNLQYADSWADRKAAQESLAVRYDENARMIEDDRTVNTLRMEECRAEIEKRQLFAPFDGVVTYLVSFTPETESATNKRVLSVADSTTTLFRASTVYWSYFKAGMEIPITVDEIEYTGVVETEETLGIKETSHNEGSSGYVYVVLDSPAFDVSDSKSIKVQVELERRDGCLTVPIGAIDTINDKPVVYYPGENGMKCYKEVETGLLSQTSAEILSGLSEGETVIINR